MVGESFPNEELTLKLSVCVDGSRYSLKVEGWAQDRPFWLPDIGSLADLRDIRRTIATDLENFKDLLEGALDITDEGVLAKAFTLLDNSGQYALIQLLGDRPRESPMLKKFVQTSFTLWRTTGLVPRVGMYAPFEAMMPVELLPLLDESNLALVSVPQRRGAAFRRFLGFSSAVARRLTADVSEDDATREMYSNVLRSVPALPMKLFHHGAELAAAAAELDYLMAASIGTAVEGPWPEVVVNEAEAQGMAIGAMYNPSRSFGSRPRLVPDQVQHYACHCEVDVDSPESSSIRLAGADSQEVSLTLKELAVGFSRLEESSDSRRADVPMPLVFLNACGSSIVNARNSISFPRHFLYWRSRGVIGTEAAVPDQVASEFAQLFYRALLDGTPTGEALYWARLLLLERRGNPLGIIYSYFGDPSLTVERVARGEEYDGRPEEDTDFRFGGREWD